MKKVFILISAISLISFSCLLAQEAQPVKKSVLDQALEKKSANNIEKKATEEPFEIPEWVHRTNIAIEAGSDMKPKYFLETIQPLFGSQNKETVLFNQTRISAKSDRTTYNSGFGLRRIFKDSYLLGLNTFYDFQDLHQHHRLGAGLEALTDRGLEGRLNTYWGISSKRLVQDDAGGQHFEKVASGLDWELGGPLPYIPFLKLYGGGYWYNFEKFTNKFGWQMRMEYNPIKYSRLTFIMLNDNKRNDMAYRFEGAMTLAFTSFRPEDILNDIRVSKEMFPKIKLEDRVLDRVVRDFDITVITTTSSGGFTVEGGKT